MEQTLIGKRALILCAAGVLCDALRASLAEQGACVTCSEPSSDPDWSDVDLLLLVSSVHPESEDSVSNHARRLEAAAASMGGRGFGRVIQLVYVQATRTAADESAVHLRAAEWRSMTNTCARRHAAAGVTVNLLELALVDGENKDDPLADDVLRRTPLARVVTSSEVAAAAVFLAEPQAASMTGTFLPVTGGLGLGLFPEQLR